MLLLYSLQKLIGSLVRQPLLISLISIYSSCCLHCWYKLAHIKKIITELLFFSYNSHSFIEFVEISAWQIALQSQICVCVCMCVLFTRCLWILHHFMQNAHRVYVNVLSYFVFQAFRFLCWWLFRIYSVVKVSVYSLYI